MTIHPGAARTSAREFGRDSWLDFHMLQSGHMADAHMWSCEGGNRCDEVYELIDKVYDLRPVKPVLDGESIYDTKPDNFYGERRGPRVGADVIRRKAYWTIFSGSVGFVYGHNDLEIFYVPGERSDHGQIGHWRDGLHAVASEQMQHIRQLMESRSPPASAPDQALLKSDPNTGMHHVRAIRSPDSSYAYIYLPMGGSVTVDLERLAGPVRASWFDPRSGSMVKDGQFATDRAGTFNAPGVIESGNDWVLILETAHARGKDETQTNQPRLPLKAIPRTDSR